jgi:PAS domain-containing protein
MRESTELKATETPGRRALIEGLSNARSVAFALVDMEGQLVAYNPEFAKAVDWDVAADDISRTGTALGDKLAEASKTAAWQGVSVKTTWTEGGWSEFEALPAGDEGAIILGHMAVPRSCLVADQDRQVLYNSLFADHPLPMLMIEPNSKVVTDANRAAAEMLGLRKDILISMVADQTGLAVGGELSSVPSGTGHRASMLYKPRNPQDGERRLAVMLDRVNLGGLDQVLITVLDTEQIAEPRV